ncbi:MAG: hypothetical protein F6K39_36650 [Okeania sp. SIO3B3]|nr:hypothetical protein [Okeania sp. SIO3B3]
MVQKISILGGFVAQNNPLYHVRLNTYTLAEGRQRAEGSYAEGREESLK